MLNINIFQHTSKRYFTLLATCILIPFLAVSCKNKNITTICGSVSGAEGKMIYLEAKRLHGSEVMDSVKIHNDGSFCFKKNLPELPEFYRLRLDNQFITLAIDSVSKIQVHSDIQNFATGYSVSGSKSSEEIKEIFLAQLDANVAISKDLAEFNKGLINDSTFYARQQETTECYKQIALKYIYSNPASMSAYFALFQEVGGNLIFNIYKQDDSKAFAAVATSFDIAHPESDRSKHLHDIALYSLASVRAQRREAQNLEKLKDIKNIEQIGYIDIALPNVKGDTIKLSAVAKDKTCLLSFTSMSFDWSVAYCESINELYKAYHNKGLEIYQIGLERDVHRWLTIAEQYPWINVQDNDAQFSRFVGYYNLESVPTLFIIDKSGEIVGRYRDLAAVDAWLKKNL